ncbi:MAG: TRAP transporter small permease [Burkholderiales bacterium]|jgi:TRAP-type C4-dicarboxylate transport system permease small subunit
MNELLILFILAVATAGLVALWTPVVNRVAWRIENALSMISAGLIMLAMLLVSAEVISRRLFNLPIPGQLELGELLMPPIIFLAITYTQSTGGHVRMTLAIDHLPVAWRRACEILGKLLSIGVCAVLCFYSARYAWRAWEFHDVTMSPPYFLIWPSALMVPIGLFLLTLRIYLETLHLLFPQLLPGTEPGLASASSDE